MVQNIDITRLQVVRFKQADFTLYTGVMTVRQLMDHAITTEWNPGLGWVLEGQGYQRAPEERHWRGIGTFLQREEDPLLPNNALLASRDRDYGDLQFIEIENDLGYLEVPDNRSLFIVDYQHRWRGFKHAIENLHATPLLDVRIPVTIMSDTTHFEETKQFFLLNNKQKRVDTDLALTLINAMAADSSEEELSNLVGPSNKYRIRATRIVVRIAQMDSGPWAGKIEEPNGPRNPLQIASIKSFVDSLRPIVSVRSQVRNFSDDDLLELLTSIWQGVIDLFPEWETNFQRFNVQRTIGLFVFHRVASQLLIPKMLTVNDRSSQMVTTTLNGVRPWLDQDFWRIGGRVGSYSSGSGQRDLAEQIVRSLP